MDECVRRRALGVGGKSPQRSERWAGCVRHGAERRDIGALYSRYIAIIFIYVRAEDIQGVCGWASGKILGGATATDGGQPFNALTFLTMTNFARNKNLRKICGGQYCQIALKTPENCAVLPFFRAFFANYPLYIVDLLKTLIQDIVFTFLT